MTQAWERLEDVFVGLGFTVAEGPEVETDWHNFEALNMPTSHPARNEFDTLFVDHAGAPAGTTVLRTHTSPVQIRTMLEQEPPIYIVAPGRVFRRDTPDATHMPVFHQIEGLVIDRDINLGHLAGTIEAFTKAFFGEGFTSRLRPSYFPFTEPSGEFDIRTPGGEWLELGGCGMVHPNVLRSGGIDPEEWSGFAFGFGIDRMAKERHHVEDLREMFTGDIRFDSSEQVLHEGRAVVAARLSRRSPTTSTVLDSTRSSGLRDARAAGRGRASNRRRRRRRHGPRRAHRAPSRRGQGAPGVGRRRRRRRAPRLVRRVQLRTPATSCRSPPSARRCRTVACIGSRGILGIDSEGMLCSAHELGLGSDHSGILVLPADTPLGVPYGDVIGLVADVVFDVDVTRNRPDAYGHLGVARDLARAARAAASPPPAPALAVSGEPERRRSVDIVAGDRAAGSRTVLSGVAVGPSAPWMAARLRAGRPAPDQQRRRREQLRDARAEPAEPRLRPRHPGRRRHSGSASPPDGERLTTLDGVDADADRRRPADL